MGKQLIISFDGGGVLGIGPATFMRNWEAEASVPRGILAGTSAGSILAAASAFGLPWSSVYRHFKEGAPEIFEKPGWAWRLDPRKPKYDGKGLIRVLRSVFGDKKMSQAVCPLFIVSMDFTRGRPKVFDTSDSTPVVEAVAASCSAPTFFPPRGGLADGGLIANSPSVVAIAGAVSKLGISPEDLWCLSLGTNGDYWRDPKVGENTNKLQWADLLLTNPTRGNEELAVFQSGALLPNQFLRVEPILQRNYGLDSLEALPAYEAIWDGLWVSRKAEVVDFITKFKGGPNVVA